MKKKKVHRLENKSESTRNRLNKKSSQKGLSAILASSPLKTKFNEPKLQTGKQDPKMMTMYQPGDHHHAHGKKCDFHLTTLTQD